MIGKICAIIPAAGYSMRMGFFKPLQGLRFSLVIEKTVNAFQKAGIEDIRVVIGYKGHLLIPVLEKLGVQAIKNPQYHQGMYSSILTGIQTIKRAATDYFFILPGDLPFVMPQTIKQMAAWAAESGNTDVFYPVYKGKKGHPPLISTRCCRSILDSRPAEGLNEVLKNNKFCSQSIDVDDPGILLDLDVASDYQKAENVKLLEEQVAAFPSKSRCLEILEKASCEERVILHCQEVARIALILGEHLNSRGYNLNLGLVMAGGLLHDLAKGEEDHAGKGREIISALGYQEVAEVVGSHMKISFVCNSPINEATLVYLADKMVQENQLVTLEERKAYARIKYPDIPQQVIEERFAQAFFLKTKIEETLNQKVENIVGKKM